MTKILARAHRSFCTKKQISMAGHHSIRSSVPQPSLLKKSLAWIKKHAAVIGDVFFALFLIIAIAAYVKYRERIILSAHEADVRGNDVVASGIASIIVAISSSTGAGVHRLVADLVELLCNLSSAITIAPLTAHDPE